MRLACANCCSSISASLLVLFMSVVLAGCQKPDFSSIHGQDINLRDAQDRWMILNIWAEWCEPCRDEIPDLNALSQKGAIRVVGHDFDAERGKVLKEKVEAMGIEFPVIEENPLHLLGSKPPQILPATYFVSPEGELIDTLYGPQTGDSIEQHVSKLQQQVLADG